MLDCGCGGGANMKRLLKKCPRGVVKGIDYSPVSVEKTKKVNETAIVEGRCTVLQGSVADMIFADNWFDAVTAFETVYFWPDLPQCFREVCRVLKPDGTFLICNESSGDTDKDEKWTEIIGGMTIYSGDELKTFLENAGFCNVQIHKNKMGWLCVTGQKRRNKECCCKRFWKDWGWGRCWSSVCAVGIHKGAVGMAHLYDEKVQERCIALGLTTKGGSNGTRCASRRSAFNLPFLCASLRVCHQRRTYLLGRLLAVLL